MAPGTSPSVTRRSDTAVSDNYYVAYQGSNGDLWSFDGAFKTGRDNAVPMASGASPSVRADLTPRAG